MNAVYKYPFEVTDEIEIQAPLGAEPLYVGVQNGIPCLWMRVNTNSPDVTHKFRLAGTGHPLNGARVGKYVGRIEMAEGQLVFHLFTVV